MTELIDIIDGDVIGYYPIRTRQSLNRTIGYVHDDIADAGPMDRAIVLRGTGKELSDLGATRDKQGWTYVSDCGVSISCESIDSQACGDLYHGGESWNIG